MTLEDPTAPPLLWTEILQKAARFNKTPSRTLLVLGDSQSGKKSIVQQLLETGVNAGATTSPALAAGGGDRYGGDGEIALSYRFVQVRREDDAEDSVMRLGVYKLGGNQEYHPLLHSLLNVRAEEAKQLDWDTSALTFAEILSTMAVVIVLDWEKPWFFLESLEKWIRIVRDMIQKAVPNSQDLVEAKAKLEATIKTYTEPSTLVPNDGDAGEGEGTTAKSSHVIPSSALMLLPLTEGCLLENLGIPIVVVCAKSDSIFKLEKENKLDDFKLDYIQQALRVQCLKYGAALFYVSKFRSESALLGRYLQHRLLGDADEKVNRKHAGVFPEPAQVVEKDFLFVPSGWDSYRKIEALNDRFDCAASAGEQGQSMYMQTLGAAPVVADTVDENVTLTAADEQSFLERQSARLPKSNAGMSAMHVNTSVQLPLSTVSSSIRASSVATSAPLSAPVASRKSVPTLISSATPASAPTMAPKSAAPSNPSLSSLTGSGVQTPGRRISAFGTAPSASERKAVEEAVASGFQSPAQTEVLSNFFGSLLQRKPSGTPAATPTTNSAAAAAALDRIKAGSNLQRRAPPPS